jgi:hypothetical protein
MPVKPKQLTLEQRIQRGIEVHQFTIDDYRTHPDTHLHCNFCGDAILVDYFQFGVMDMKRRLMNFVSSHSKCEPQLVTKTKDMTLTPKERAS